MASTPAPNNKTKLNNVLSSIRLAALVNSVELVGLGGEMLPTTVEFEGEEMTPDGEDVGEYAGATITVLGPPTRVGIGVEVMFQLGYGTAKTVAVGK